MRTSLTRLVAGARRGTLTLVYGARDPEHNQARVPADVIEARLEA